MRLLAVSSPVDTEVDGSKPPTIKDEGVDLELTNWRMLVAPPGISDAERERITGWVEKVMEDAGLAGEPQALRLDAVRQDRRRARRLRGLRAEARAGRRRRARDRQAVIGARVFGGVLLALGVIAFVATLGVGDGWAASGPRLAPAVSAMRSCCSGGVPAVAGR